jgi:hypothetical protein
LFGNGEPYRSASGRFTFESTVRPAGITWEYRAGDRGLSPGSVGLTAVPRAVRTPRGRRAALSRAMEPLGQPLVYTASSAALAVLEARMHLDLRPDLLPEIMCCWRSACASWWSRKSRTCRPIRPPSVALGSQSSELPSCRSHQLSFREVQILLLFPDTQTPPRSESSASDASPSTAGSGFRCDTHAMVG